MYCIKGKRINPQNSIIYINSDNNNAAKYYICNISGGVKNTNEIEKYHDVVLLV